MKSRFETVGDLLRWCSDAPEGTRLSARELAVVLEELADVDETELPQTATLDRPESTWRTKLWRCPAETRIGVKELIEALGVSESWVYSRTKESADPRLPHAKFGGALVFKAGEIRAWLRDQEHVEVGYRMESTPGELRLHDGEAA